MTQAKTEALAALKRVRDELTLKDCPLRAFAKGQKCKIKLKNEKEIRGIYWPMNARNTFEIKTFDVFGEFTRSIFLFSEVVKVERVS